MNECNIVRDLIPLYADDIASPDSEELILRHTESCESCRLCLQRCKEEVPAMTDEHLKDYKKIIKKSKWKEIFCVLAYLLACAAFMAGLVAWQLWQRGEFSVVESFTSPDGARSFEILDFTYGDEMRLRQVIRGKGGGINQHKAPFQELEVYWANDSQTCVFMAENLDGEQEIHIIAQGDQVGGGLWEIDGDLGDIVHILNAACGQDAVYLFSHWETDCETVVFTWEGRTVRYHYPTETVTVE